MRWTFKVRRTLLVYKKITTNDVEKDDVIKIGKQANHIIIEYYSIVKQKIE